MNFEILEKEELWLMLNIKTFNITSSSKEIPEFWNEYNNSYKTSHKIGIFLNYNENSNDFKYGIGHLLDSSIKIYDGFEAVRIPAFKWVVFKDVGALPYSIETLWEKIHIEWMAENKCNVLKTYHLEFHPEGDSTSDDYVCEIWIPLIS